MNQEVVHGPENGPKEGEQRADDALHVAPEVGVVPQPDLQELQAEHTGNVLNQRHPHRHGSKQHNFIPERVGNQAEPLQGCQQIQSAQAETVDGQPWPGAETGIDDFFRTLGQISEQQLQHPPQNGTYKEQVRQCQQHTHSNHSFTLKIHRNDERRRNYFFPNCE